MCSVFYIKGGETKPSCEFKLFYFFISRTNLARNKQVAIFIIPWPGDFKRCMSFFISRHDCCQSEVFIKLQHAVSCFTPLFIIQHPFLCKTRQRLRDGALHNVLFQLVTCKSGFHITSLLDAGKLIYILSFRMNLKRRQNKQR